MNEERKGITVYTAEKYHRIYQYDIAYKLSEAHHLSCIMPVSIGLYPLVFYLSEILFDKRITVIMQDEQTKNTFNSILIAWSYYDALLFPVTVDEFLQNKQETDAYILFQLNQNARIEVGDILIPKKNRIVISIGQPELGQVKDARSRSVLTALDSFAELTMSDTTPHPVVLAVESILDVRDIMLASVEEKSKLAKQLQSIVHVYQYEAEKIKEYKAQKENNNSGSTTAVLSELEELKEQLSNMKRLNEAMALVIESVGVSKEDLQTAAEKLVAIKEHYQEKYGNQDGSDDESEITEMQNETAKILSQVTSRKLTAYNRETYENILIGLLSRDVWERLNSNSKSYLISARMNYQAMVSSIDADSIDYSGVCLQITKVLDEEMADRVYHKYRKYLEKEHRVQGIDKWPAGLTVRLRTGQLAVASSENFTLGSVSRTLGVDGTGKIVNKRDFDNFCEFAATHLYKPILKKVDVAARVRDIAVTAEKVRKDYRNPSAHRNALSRQSAESCMDYMIDQIRKLRRILEDMKV